MKLCFSFLLFLSFGICLNASSQDFSPSSKPGVLGDEEVWYWGNGVLKIGRSTFVPGSELILAGSWLYNIPWVGCKWFTPNGEIWTHEGEQVVDSKGDVVEGVTVWGETEATCGIKILVASSEVHKGQWFVEHKVPTETPFLFSIETDDEVSSGLRLPSDFVPISYNVELIPELNVTIETFPGSRTRHKFRGMTNMSLLSVASQSKLTFHSDELDILTLQLWAKTTEEDISKNIKQYIVDFQRTFITLDLDTPFLQFEIYRLDLTFKADLDRGLYFNYGFYHRACSDYTDVHCWYTQFESTNARNAFPCLDEPHLKANFSLSVGRSPEYKTRSNMPLQETVPLNPIIANPGEEDWVLDIYKSSVSMSPYLVAVTVTNYAALESEIVEGGPITSVWAPADFIKRGLADYASIVGPSIISFYETLFGVKYPLPKMDLMYEPHKGGAMENWGLILFDERALLIEPDSTDVDYRFQVLSVIAHELAHQWFGNLVTCNWWSQTWLNEGFATYVSYLGSDSVDPSMNSWERMYVRVMQRVMTYDQDTKQHWAMTDPVGDRNDIERKFGVFTYDKGGSVIRMMEQMLGTSTFIKGLSYYLSSSSYLAPTEDDLFFNLEEAGLEDGVWPQGSLYAPQGSFAETMKGWTNQAGLPLVTVRKSCSNDGCILFFAQEWLTETPQDEVKVWNIPITYTLAGQSQKRPEIPQAWLTTDYMALDNITGLTPDTTFIINVDGFGYYRVNYDEDSWRTLAQTLLQDHTLISPMNRAQVICDVMALEKTGHVSNEIVSEILAYFPQETEYAPKIAHERCSTYSKDDFRLDREETWRI